MSHFVLVQMSAVCVEGGLFRGWYALKVIYEQFIHQNPVYEYSLRGYCVSEAFHRETMP